jgi:hypothetical protein
MEATVAAQLNGEDQDIDVERLGKLFLSLA